ncbi:penicillin acylase family protein [Gallaecimonas xiamenensis]|uniref:Aculeacin A acylase n=1 Tax=Gallaecimonas xiamenensis 3-C-1 TaxID=745411 RepID=K2K3B1_9GAMM|nr:penicillin acylase family protein [Gallaecimonas xiamenensis]EKE77419.1 aculeacin A acylase [Gallaecimonas xiamenensis 3-C-1]
MQRHTSLMALGALSCLWLAGCGDSSDDNNPPLPSQRFQANITYTSHGVPHIQATDYAGLGYGIGYAQARDNLCTLSEQLMKLKAQKTRYFGAGSGQANLLSDIGYQALDYEAQAQSLYANLSADAKALMEGYAAGFNRSLDERQGPEQYPSPCRGADWVTAISAQDLLAYQLDLAGMASARSFLPAIAAAQPPESGATALNAQLDASQVFTAEGIGSNGWALGQDKMADAKSGLLGNPHFPWDGELRFFEQHLTIPGELDVTGVGMIGLPVVVIGFNQHLGWTHTVSQSKRFTLYQLELDPQNPLRYKFDDQYLDMTSKTLTVTVKQADGSLVEVPRTVYFSRFGPVVDLSSLSPALGWTQASAISFRDANAGNIRMLEQWLAMDKAQSRDAFFGAFADHQGLPWVNTLMVADDGSASYMDGTQVPQLGAQAEGYWAAASQSPQLAPIWQDGAGSVLLPGNSAAYDWVDSGDAGAPGLVPFSKAPQATRQDYLFNANSSHWLANLDAPLEGYSLMYGPERTVRSPRTRYNAQLISGTGEVNLAGSDGRFSLAELQRVLTHNSSLFAGSFRNALVSRCSQYPSIQVDGSPFDLTPACTALANWDGTYNLDSTGAQVMREFLAAFRVSGHRTLADSLFAEPFDPARAAFTPAGLAPMPSLDPNEDPVLQALAAAAKRLNGAGIALDAPLRDLQYVLKATGKAAIPVTGANAYEGVFNMAETKVPSRSTSDLAINLVGSPRADSPLTSLDEDGSGATERYRINYGSSFVMALAFGEQGPQAQMFLSYSQAHDPESPFFDDQTQAYSQLAWRPMLFSADQVAAEAVETLDISGN